MTRAFGFYCASLRAGFCFRSSCHGKGRSTSGMASTVSLGNMVRAASRTEIRPDPAKLRVLCLHGYRTSGQIMKQQLELANWSAILSDIVEFLFLDAPWPARGKADVENKFAGPYYEWYQTSKDYTEIYNVDESVSHICAFISSHGPFDGIMGFSQGAMLAGALIGFHARGMGPDLKKINFLVTIGGGKSKATVLQPAYFDLIERPSLHLIGEKDFMRDSGELMQKAFKDAVVIKHPWGHVIPRLGAPEEKVLRDFFLKQLDFKLLKSGKVKDKHKQSISPI